MRIHHACLCRIGVGIPARDKAWRVPGLNSYPEGEISLSSMDWLMMDSFSPTFKWIAPRNHVVMWEKFPTWAKTLSHIGKGRRMYFRSSALECIPEYKNPSWLSMLTRWVEISTRVRLVESLVEVPTPRVRFPYPTLTCSWWILFLFFSDDYEKKYHSERDINLTDVHYSRPSNKIFVAYSMYPAFLYRPGIILN